MQKAYELGYPTLVLANTKKLAQEYLARSQAEGIPSVLYKPREAPAKDGSTTPHTCFKIEAVEEAGAKHHRPAQSLCRECPHGMRVALDNPHRQEAAIRFFDKKRLTRDQIDSIEPCRFLYEGLPAQLRERHLIATHAAFSEALVEYRDDHMGRERTTQRLVIVDEAFPLTESIKIDAHAIEVWQSRIDGVLESLDRGRFRDAEADAEKIKTALDLSKIALSHTAIVIHSADGLSKKELRQKLDGLKDIVSAAVRTLNESDLINGGTAIFEKITHFDSEFFIPLRALNALNTALKKGTARIDMRKIHVEAISPLFEHVMKRGSVILLDATPSVTIREVVMRANGQILDAHIKQNIVVRHYPQKMFARGNPEIDGYRNVAKKAVLDLAAFERQRQDQRQNRPCAFITHKAYLENAGYGLNADEVAAIFAEETHAKIGWFGAHDRGHNEYEGHDLVIGGMPILGAKSIAELWHQHATILNQIGVDVDFELSPKDPRYTYYLPTDKHQREFLLNYYAAHLVQAIGRARGINADAKDPLHIHILGGIPEVLEYLKPYKIDVERNWTYAQAARKNNPIRDILNTAKALVEEGLKLAEITVSRLQTACKEGESGLKHRREIVCKVLRKLKEQGFDAFVQKWPKLKKKKIGLQLTPPTPTTAFAGAGAHEAVPEVIIHLEGLDELLSALRERLRPPL